MADTTQKLKSVDRGLRRAVVGGVVGATLGVPVGGLLGGLESWIYVGHPMFGVVYGAVCGGISGFPLGGLVIVKDDRQRRLWALFLGGMTGVVAGWLIGHAVSMWSPSNLRDSRYLEIVGPYLAFGVAAGVIGGWCVVTALSRLRTRWPWMRRWDSWPNDGLRDPEPMDDIPTTTA